MKDLGKTIAFMESIHGDIQNMGEAISIKGNFTAQRIEGVAKLSGGDYQFIIEGSRALVAVIDFDFEVNEEDSYILSGTLICAGEFGLFPGIKVSEIKKA